MYCNNIVQGPARHCVFSHTTTKGKECEKSRRQADRQGDRQVLGVMLKQQAQGGGRQSEGTQQTFLINLYLFSPTHTLFHTFITLGSSGPEHRICNINV